jgi:hypothetical protein
MERISDDPRPYAPCVALEQRAVTPLGEVYLLPTPSGLRPDSYDHVRRFLVDVVTYFTMRLGCTHESYIALHQSGARETIALFGSHAPSWLPETILGVWPHLPAPSMMTSEALMESRSPKDMRMYTLFRITAGGDACIDAMSTMLGTGTGIQILTRKDTDSFLRNQREIFLNFIKESLYRVFPWYIPLLAMKSLEEPITPLTEESLTNVTLYIRESPEEKGVLILAREPLDEVLLWTGCNPVDLADGSKQWRLPYDYPLKGLTPVQRTS